MNAVNAGNAGKLGSARLPKESRDIIGGKADSMTWSSVRPRSVPSRFPDVPRFTGLQDDRPTARRVFKCSGRDTERIILNLR